MFCTFQPTKSEEETKMKKKMNCAENFHYQKISRLNIYIA